jgi:hypothetical protein
MKREPKQEQLGGTDGVAGVYLEVMSRLDTERPRKADREALRELLAKQPGLWRAVLGASDSLAAHLMDKMYYKTGPRQAAELGYRELRAEMGFDAAPPVEQLLIDHIAITWLRLHLVERRHANECRVGTPEIAFWEQRLNAAQRRFLRATEAFVRFKKLTRPRKSRGKKNADSE